jgi:hypothetical protein
VGNHGRSSRWKSSEVGISRALSGGNPPGKVRTGSNRQAGRNPEDGSSRAARPGEDRLDRTCCGDAEPQESHRERTQFTRRPVREDSKGRPNARRDAAPDERCPERTKGAPEPRGGQREALPSVSPAARRGNGACQNPWKPGQRRTRSGIKAAGSSQSSEGEERWELTSMPVD